MPAFDVHLPLMSLPQSFGTGATRRECQRRFRTWRPMQQGRSMAGRSSAASRPQGRHRLAGESAGTRRDALRSIPLGGISAARAASATRNSTACKKDRVASNWLGAADERPELSIWPTNCRILRKQRPRASPRPGHHLRLGLHHLAGALGGRCGLCCRPPPIGAGNLSAKTALGTRRCDCSAKENSATGPRCLYGLPAICRRSIEYAPGWRFGVRCSCRKNASLSKYSLSHGATRCSTASIPARTNA